VNVLVTGATGFLGRHLVCHLRERGDLVRALVRPQTDATFLERAEAEVVRGQVLDAEAVRRASADCRLVFHAAGLVSYERRDLPRLREANVDTVRTVLAAIEPEARLVHVSSLAAVGPSSSPDRLATEDQPFPAAAAGIPYCATKREAERLLLAAAAKGRDIVIANPSVALGPGDAYASSTWVVPRYLKGRIRMYVDGGTANVDARDAAAGLVALADRGRTGERYILTAPDGNLSWRDFFDLVARVTGVRRRMVRLPGAAASAGASLLRWPVEPGRVRAARFWWFASAAKAERELGLRTRPFAETIADTAAEYLA
jgi:dihydroflavonol-4-reductase